MSNISLQDVSRTFTALLLAYFGQKDDKFSSIPYDIPEDALVVFAFRQNLHDKQ